MQEQDIKNLLDKYYRGECTPEEILEVELWYFQETGSSDWDLDATEIEPARLRILDKLNHRIDRSILKKHRITLWPRIVVAASVLLVAGLGLYIYSAKFSDQTQSFVVYANDIAPGKNTATLTLASGRKILLSDEAKGQLAEEAGVRITRTDNGQLIYTSDSSKNLSNIDRKPIYENNTIATPAGGQCEVILPDGTKVTLNAASTLKYPTSFVSLKERKVELSGEGYFVVKHNAKQPFRVESKGQIVEDIGTEFNINAYKDESVVKTTLVEGAARIVTLNPAVMLSLSKHALRQAQGDTGETHGDTGQAQRSSSIVLKPNQQSILTNTGTIKVATINVDEAVAWKNGAFVFNGENLQSIMRIVSRWYNVEVEYGPSAPKNLELVALVSRSKNISAVLNALQQTGKVHFKIEGRKVTVLP